jgi:hypothetical protein
MQDLNIINNILEEKITHFPKIQLSTIFRYLRNLECLSSIGDFPILIKTVKFLKSKKNQLTKNSVRKALNYSDELKHREVIVDILFNS